MLADLPFGAAKSLPGSKLDGVTSARLPFGLSVSLPSFCQSGNISSCGNGRGPRDQDRVLQQQDNDPPLNLGSCRVLGLECQAIVKVPLPARLGNALVEA